MGALDGIVGPMSPDDVRALTPSWLAGKDLAHCFPPDTDYGVAFLTGVRDAALYWWENSDREDPHDAAMTIANEAADAALGHSYHLWLTFADLGAYTEDPEEEYGPGLLDRVRTEGSDIFASLHLFMIAERLAANILESLRLWLADQPDTDESDDTDAAGDGTDDDNGAPIGGDDIRPAW